MIIKDATGSNVYLDTVGEGTEADPFRTINYAVSYDNGKVPFYQLMDIVGDELQVIINDGLTYLVDQRVSAQGYYQ